MKPGDIFTDGDRTLKVIDFDGQGRPISKVIAYGEAKEEMTSEEASTPKRRSRKIAESVE